MSHSGPITTHDGRSSDGAVKWLQRSLSIASCLTLMAIVRPDGKGAGIKGEISYERNLNIGVVLSNEMRNCILKLPVARGASSFTG